jgi:hypothetical protein
MVYVPQAKPFSYANPPDYVDAPWLITSLVYSWRAIFPLVSLVLSAAMMIQSAANSTADQETSQDPKFLVASPLIITVPNQNLAIIVDKLGAAVRIYTEWVLFTTLFVTKMPLLAKVNAGISKV